MTDWRRYAVFVAPPPGPLAQAAADWLGWDPVTGGTRAQPDLAGLPRPADALTRTPRKYGFHGTIRAPFRPADGLDAGAIRDRMAAMCAGLAPVTLDGLAIAPLGRFLALRPEGPTEALDALAAEVVRRTDSWRAPLSADERARRKPDDLPPNLRANLDRWGYPHVMEAFRFHMTLTGALEAGEPDQVACALAPYLGPHLPRPARIDALALFGEASDGWFHVIDRYKLTG